jgi:hypothetical protein
MFRIAARCGAMVGEIAHLAGESAIRPAPISREILNATGGGNAVEFKAALGRYLVDNATVQCSRQAGASSCR